MTIFWIVAPRGLVQCSSIRLEPRTPSPKLSHELWLNRIAYRVTKTLTESTVISLFQCESKQKCDKNVKLATMQYKKNTINWTQETITHNMRIAVEKHGYCWRLPTFRRNVPPSPSGRSGLMSLWKYGNRLQYHTPSEIYHHQYFYGPDNLITEILR
jgi:hypothetical protein